ncbi:PIN domain-containing protein [Pseudomonas putida]|uniref:PIN domain-containing protein n=1 Tax=Pseudomonas putida TaxID=303 RepID=UPI001F0713AC|nr:PIN domain-containing protein [Pseudomonas putida]
MRLVGFVLKKSELPMILALEHLVEKGVVKLLVPDLVLSEYERNKDRVIDATRKRLTAECKVVRDILNSFGGDQKKTAIDAIDDVNHRLPLLAEANLITMRRVQQLFQAAIHVPVSDASKLKAAERALAKKAPFHKQKNSLADAVLLETFDEFRQTQGDEYESLRFITANVSDFSAEDHRKPHIDFAEIFDDERTKFFSTVAPALGDLFDIDEFKTDHGWAWEDQTRGLQEILETMDELVDKVWYNRHMLRAALIEEGRIKLIPAGTKHRANFEIHEDIWAGALASANSVKDRYAELGPWTDFEWGMINGKLSALRWVLGDHWDNLDT